MARPLHETYELYLSDGVEPPRFEALTCPPDADLFTRVRLILEDRNLISIEVRRLGTHMFTVRA